VQLRLKRDDVFLDHPLTEMEGEDVDDLAQLTDRFNSFDCTFSQF
jgi:hypothetical protein